MEENLKNSEWYSGQNCDCGGQVWHFKGEDTFRCNKCNSRYGIVEETTKEKLDKMKGVDEKEEGWLKKIWAKTIFPDMIKARKERKRIERKRKKEEKELVDEVKSEARKEAIQELKPTLKEQIKQQEIDRMTGKTKAEKKKKFAEAFSFGGMGGGDPNKPNKYVDMLGMGQSGVGSDDKISKMLGKGSGTDKIASDEHMKGMIGGMGRQPEVQTEVRQTRGPQRGKKRQKQVDPVEEKIRRMLS